MVNADGEKVIGFHPFHTYTMKQSIAEKNTFDVLEHYTTYKRYFKLYKKIEEDKEVPKSRVQRQLVSYVDIQPHTIREKIKVMLDHFVHHTAKKIEGKVFVQFIVNHDGTLSDIEVIRGIGEGCDEEAIRVIELTDKMWVPGKHEEKIVKTRMVVPISFKLSR